uniref:Uncharacterized protein n=1 Tax=Arundo donax TaxID=35708 RepID=A0A0A8Y6Q7_ARUDO
MEKQSLARSVSRKGHAGLLAGRSSWQYDFARVKGPLFGFGKPS